MYFLYVFLFCSTYLISPSVDAHEFHISNMECNVNTDEATIEITLRIFIDDLEAALLERGHGELKLCTTKEDSLSNNYVIDYLQDKLKLTVNNHQLLEYSFIGKEASEDLTAVWIYLGVEQIEEIQVISIYNDILMELFDDQKNIIAVKKNSKRKAHWIFDLQEVTNAVEF